MSTTRRTDAPPRRPLSELMDRQPPFDLQAEIGVLGSIVLLPDVLDDVVMILRPDDFYDDAHRKLFVHMTALHEMGKKIDDTLLVNRLKTAGDYELIGGDRSDSAVKSIRDVVLDAMERLDARMAGTHSAGGCDFGFHKLDEKTAGLHQGELVILAARPSMGKTAFAMNVAENVALHQN